MKLWILHFGLSKHKSVTQKKIGAKQFLQVIEKLNFYRIKKGIEKFHRKLKYLMMVQKNAFSWKF